MFGEERKKRKERKTIRSFQGQFVICTTREDDYSCHVSLFTFLISVSLLRSMSMSAANSGLPPRSQTRSSSLRVRSSRSSTTDRILHQTLANRSPSPSSSSVTRRRRESSISE